MKNFLSLTLNYLSIFLAACIFAFAPLPQFGADSDKLGLAALMAVFILTSFIHYFININSTEKSKFKIQLIDYAMLCLICAGFVSVMGSYFFKDSLAGFIKYALYFAFYIALVLRLKRASEYNIIIGACLVGAIWPSIEALNQYLFGAEALATWEDPNIHISEQLNRIYSTFGNPNLYGSYLLAIWPLCLWPLVHIIKKKNIKLWLKTGLSLSLVILILTFMYFILQTGSRGAWLGLAAQITISLLFCFLLLRRKFIWLNFALPTLIGLVLLYLFSRPSFLARLLTIFSSYEHSSNAFRLHVWAACLHIFKDNILFGIGTGSKAFYDVYGIYMDAKYSALGAYSLILEIMVEMGLLGLFSFLFLIYSLCRAAYKGLEIAKTNTLTSLSLTDWNYEKFYILICLIALSGLLISSLFDIVILRPQIQTLTCLLIALMRFYTLSKFK